MIRKTDKGSSLGSQITEHVRRIAIDQIEVSPFNPRKIFTGIEELAKSIQSQGLLQYLQVRKAPKGEGFELVAGERRLKALAVAGIKEVPCIVRELTDQQAREIIVTENLQREGLHPLEEAAGVASLLEAGESLKEIAARLGRDLRWVAKRAKLLDLARPWRTALEAGKLERWTIGHFELVATLAPEAQEAFWKEHQYLGHWSIEDLQRNIGQWQLKIISAPWKADDASLPGGACTACPKRSSHTPELFDDVDEGDELLAPGKVSKDDRCLNNVCWNAKAAEVAKRKVVELGEIHGAETVLQIDEMMTHQEQQKAAKQGRVGANYVVPAKKTDPKARPAVIVSGDGAGRVKWVKPSHGTWKDLGVPGSEPKTANGKGKKPATEKRPLAEREEELHARRRRHAVAAFREWLEERVASDNMRSFSLPIPRQVSVLALVATVGVDLKEDLAGEQEWNAAATLEEDPDEALKVSWFLVLRVAVMRLKDHGGAAVDVMKKLWPEARHWSPLVHYDLEASVRDAEVALPEPKGWAKEREAIKGNTKGKTRAKPVAPKRKGVSA